MFQHGCIFWGNDQQICRSNGNDSKCYLNTFNSLYILSSPDAIQSNVAQGFFGSSNFNDRHTTQLTLCSFILINMIFPQWFFSLHISQYFAAKKVQAPRFLIPRIWFCPQQQQHMNCAIFTYHWKQKKKKTSLCTALISVWCLWDGGRKLFWCFYNL